MTHGNYGPLWQLRQLRRGKVHGGYRWLAVLADGESLCESCVEREYRLVFKATYSPKSDPQWECIRVMNSGESDSVEQCVHCNKIILEAE